MQEVHGIIALSACIMLLFAAISGRVAAWPITGPMLFMAVGAGLGPLGLNWITFSSNQPVVLWLVEITLALVLFTDAASIDFLRLLKQRATPLRLLLLGLPLVIMFGAATAVGLMALSWSQALLLGAILAATDAALGEAVFSNPKVPVRIRESLVAESGLNDGLALPLVLVFASMSVASHDSSEPSQWVLHGLKQFGIALAVGGIVGAAAGKLLAAASHRSWMAESMEGIAGIATAILAWSLAHLLDGNGFIAAFVCGLLLGANLPKPCKRLIEFDDAEGRLLTLTAFTLLGAVLLPQAIAGITWVHVLYAVLSLVLVRPLAMWLATIGEGLRPSSRLFIGWFGPRGLASVLFLILIAERMPSALNDTVQTVVCITVVLSVALHGITAAPMASAYGKRFKANDQTPEHDAQRSIVRDTVGRG